MALVILPLDNDVRNFEFRTDLDGIQFLFAFRFNERMDRWIMDIKTADDEPILMGTPILQGVTFLERFKIETLPPGRLFSINIQTLFEETGVEDLGKNLLVLYNEAS